MITSGPTAEVAVAGTSAPPLPAIVGVGTAVTGLPYAQAEVLDHFAICDRKVRSLFRTTGIRRRYLTLPPRDAFGGVRQETQGELVAKHRRMALDMGVRAVRSCLDRAGLRRQDIGYLCCVTTTGFLTPGLSALVIREMGLSTGTQRLDVVGMGCNAAMSGLIPTSSWCVAHPGKLAVMVCAEACSAAYAVDSTMQTAVVNSLFGDGAAAVAVTAPAAGAAGRPMLDRRGWPVPHLLAAESHLITDAVDAMRFDWDDDLGRWSFFLDRDIPYVIGAHVEAVVERLLAGARVRRAEVRHWLIHSGGRKVIDAVRVNLRLTRHDVRHTTEVLANYGNLSSGSVLFSYERLVEEGIARAGDYGVMIAMGPGSTIESALVQWR